MARPWFRFYAEMPSDLKVRRLTPTQRWVWSSVLAAACASPVPGYLYIAKDVPMTLAELATFADVKVKDTAQALAAMVGLGMVVFDDELIVVSNWARRQYESDSSTPRVQAFRKRSKEPDGNVSRNVSGTVAVNGSGNAPETETETEADTEEKNSPAAKPRMILPKQLQEPFDAFWAAYPRKTGKLEAQRKYLLATKLASTEAIQAGAERFARTCGDDPQYIAHPASWLHQGRWEDTTQLRAVNGGRRVTSAPVKDW